MFHQGTWVWGSAEAPRFEELWEGEGNGGVVLKQVRRERHQAMAECAKAASDQVLMKIGAANGGESDKPLPTSNGHHDWTRFWKGVRDLGLERGDVSALIDGSMPREWLEKHPESGIDDLLGIVGERSRSQIGGHLVGVGVSPDRT